MRPLARSPYNCHARHLRRSFRLANEAADALTEVFATDTPRIAPAERPPAYAHVSVG